MKTSHMHTTKWIKWEDKYGTILKTRLTYGYHYLAGNPAAHVSITEETKRFEGFWREDSFGIVSDFLVAKFFPALLPLVRWHLSCVETGPLHYVANALYWWDRVHGRDMLNRWYRESPGDPSRLEARNILLNQIVYGALEEDWKYDPVQMPREDLERWLNDRLPALISQLRADCDPLILTDSSESDMVP